MRKIPCLLPTATLTNGYQLSGWRETQTYCISGVRGPTWASLGQGQSVSRAALPLEAEGETPFAGLSQQLATASFPGLRLSVLKASRQPSQPLSDSVLLHPPAHPSLTLTLPPLTRTQELTAGPPGYPRTLFRLTIRTVTPRAKFLSPWKVTLADVRVWGVGVFVESFSRPQTPCPGGAAAASPSLQEEP